jgi:hypothetical protein
MSSGKKKKRKQIRYGEIFILFYSSTFNHSECNIIHHIIYGTFRKRILDLLPFVKLLTFYIFKILGKLLPVEMGDESKWTHYLNIINHI